MIRVLAWGRAQNPANTLLCRARMVGVGLPFGLHGLFYPEVFVTPTRRIPHTTAQRLLNAAADRAGRGYGVKLVVGLKPGEDVLLATGIPVLHDKPLNASMV